MLGVQRPTITNAVREFQRAGLIAQGREQITVLNRQASPRHLANAINWSGRASLFTFPRHTSDIVSVPYCNVHYRQHPLDYLRIRAHKRGGRQIVALQQDCIPAVEDEPVVRRCTRTRLVFDPGPGVRLATRSQ
jgi:hypothetical protein